MFEVRVHRWSSVSVALLAALLLTRHNELHSRVCVCVCVCACVCVCVIKGTPPFMTLREASHHCTDCFYHARAPYVEVHGTLAATCPGAHAAAVLWSHIGRSDIASAANGWCSIFILFFPERLYGSMDFILVPLEARMKEWF